MSTRRSTSSRGRSHRPFRGDPDAVGRMRGVRSAQRQRVSRLRTRGHYPQRRPGRLRTAISTRRAASASMSSGIIWAGTLGCCNRRNSGQSWARKGRPATCRDRDTSIRGYSRPRSCTAACSDSPHGSCTHCGRRPDATRQDPTPHRPQSPFRTRRRDPPPAAKLWTTRSNRSASITYLRSRVGPNHLGCPSLAVSLRQHSATGRPCRWPVAAVHAGRRHLPRVLTAAPDRGWMWTGTSRPVATSSTMTRDVPRQQARVRASAYPQGGKHSKSPVPSPKGAQYE
jgi:hypothetical protein